MSEGVMQMEGGLDLQISGSRVTARGQIDLTGSLSGERVPTKSKEPEAPPKSGAYKRKPAEGQSTFKTFYERGDLPVTLDNTTLGNTVHWRGFDFAAVDYHHYLPIFFDGLRETKDPYKTIARRGVKDLLEHGGKKVEPVIPQLVIPIKAALETRDPDIMCATLVALQRLVTCAEGVGKALVPYYRQILPTFNLFKNRNINSGDNIDYSQQKKQNVGDLIDETLSLLEMYGGEDAYINIKYMVPTYESCVLN